MPYLVHITPFQEFIPLSEYLLCLSYHSSSHLARQISPYRGTIFTLNGTLSITLLVERRCTHMVNIKMGERLKTLRKTKRLTLKQVSELLGVSVSVLSAYEVEDRHPSYHILLKLATLYDVSCDYLIGREKTRTLNVDGLSDREINSLAEIIAIMKEKK